MNTFGRIFRVSIFGESHGELVGVLVDGCPAGLTLRVEDFEDDLKRRQGQGLQGVTSRKEEDIPLVKSGVFNNHTTGAPILICFENSDVRSSDYESIKNIPRPGHADLVAKQKFGGFNDYRGGGHFSGRLTLGLVAAGVIAKKLLPEVTISAKLISAGGSVHVEEVVQQAQSDGDSVGGVVECRVQGLTSGLGEPFFDSVESLISHLAFSIPAIKAVEFGAGINGAASRGSEFNDSIINATGETKTNNTGGISGGLTNGNELIFRVYVKPTSSISKTQESFNLKSGETQKLAVQGRHDACIALRVSPVLEAITAIVLVDLACVENQISRVVSLVHE